MAKYGIDYGLDTRQRALDKTTDAKRREAESAKEERIRKSGQRSGLQKLASAALRGGAAWATGGASEIYGGGDLIDEIALGTDSTGRPVRNEYGQLIKAGSGIYHGMKGQKAADIAKKRASNLQDYKNKVDLAEKMGVLDKEQGAKMLLSAEELRSAQQGQTAKADKKGVWGWDNEYDPLELSSSVLKGKDVADEIPYAPSLEDETLSQEGRETHKRAGYAPSLEEGGSVQTGRGKPRPTYHPSLEDRMVPERDRGLSGEELDKGGREQREQDTQQYLLRSRISDIEPERDRGLTGEELDKGVIDPNLLKRQKMVDEMMDREYSKKLLNERGAAFIGGGRGSGISNAEMEANVAGRNALIEAQNKKASYFEPTYKTMSEKDAEKLSEKDDYRSLIDRMSDESDRGARVKDIKAELGGYRPDWSRSKTDRQLLLEDRLIKEEEQRKEKELAERIRAEEFTPTIKSALRKRAEKRAESRKKAREIALKKMGGILVQ